MTRLTRIGRWSCRLLVIAALLASPALAHAQGPQAFGVRGFADVGGTAFTAKDSFEAIFGTASWPIFGGGGDLLLPGGWFAGGRVSRLAKDGQRVFVLGDEVFDLGIDTRVTITPIELTGGYRFSLGARVIPYAGGGIGSYRYQETSEFAGDDEDVSESFTSYHILGGAEFRLGRWLGVAGEAQWTTVPDAIGQDPNSVGSAFDESNLGGTTFRVKVVVGF